LPVADLILAQKLLIKTLNKRGPKVQLCGTTDNTEQGKQDFSKLPMKEEEEKIRHIYESFL
jgi:hypothetical protein